MLSGINTYIISYFFWYFNPLTYYVPNELREEFQKPNFINAISRKGFKVETMVFKEMDLRTTSAHRNKRASLYKLHNKHEKFDMFCYNKQLCVGPILFLTSAVVAAEPSLRAYLFENGGFTTCPKFFSDMMNSIREGSSKMANIRVGRCLLSKQYFEDLKILGLEGTIVDVNHLKTDTGKAELTSFLSSLSDQMYDSRNYCNSVPYKMVPINSGRTLTLSAMYNTSDYGDSEVNPYLLNGATHNNNNLLFVVSYLFNSTLYDETRKRANALPEQACIVFEVNRPARILRSLQEAIVTISLIGVTGEGDEHSILPSGDGDLPKGGGHRPSNGGGNNHSGNKSPRASKHDAKHDAKSKGQQPPPTQQNVAVPATRSSDAVVDKATRDELANTFGRVTDVSSQLTPA